MNVLEKILEEMKKIKDGNRKEKLYGKYPPQNKRQETLNAYSQGYEDGTDNFYNAIIPIIRSHMDEASDMHGKRLIDANALDEEVRNFFLAITGNPKQATVVKECKESFRRMIDEQPTVYEANDWIPVEEKLPEEDDIRFYMCIVENHEEDLLMFCQYNELYGFGFWQDIYDSVTLGFVDTEFKTNDELGYEKVIAWQPLPEPYIKNPK